MIRESFYLSLCLLDRQAEGDVELASSIIDRLLDYQELDRESPYYGIWPYYLEEPITQMGSPDRNWADFCGKSLIQAAADYAGVLPAALVDRMKIAVEAAAVSIMRRNVMPSYTNICVMGTYVTLLAGEMVGNEELFQYGRSKLKLFHEYCTYHGAFTEYNSPTYTVVTIEDLSLMRKHIHDEASIALVTELLDMAWASVAEHFHAPTGQWAAPHSRCYDTLQGHGLLSFLQLASGGKLRMLDESELEIGALWPRVGLQIPDLYLPYFQKERTTSFTEKTIVKGKTQLFAASYMTPHYTLGSFNHCDLWNQRRPLGAYWGEKGQASYLRFRCLHDQYDFSSSLLHNVQHRNMVLGIAHFCSDHGDKHFTLDPIQGRVTVSSMRFRFEFGGNLNRLSMPELAFGKPLLIQTSHVKIGLILNECKFGNYQPRLEVTQESAHISLDVVLYEGEPIDIDLSSLEEAHLVFGLILEKADCEDAEILTRLSAVRLEKEHSIHVAYNDVYMKLQLGVQAGVIPFSQAMERASCHKETHIESDKPVWSV
jgi:hypothetical protein